MPETLAALDQRFGISGKAVVTEGRGGLPAVRVTTRQCSGEIYLLGGHVTQWKPTDAEEVLWVSQHSNYVVGKAIRGGVPVIFPWFGAKADDPKAPAHGFVRSRAWELESVDADGDDVTVTMLTRSDDSSRAALPAEFELRLHASFGAQLRLELQLSNPGTQPLRFEEALHSYFTVGDVRQISIRGLDGTSYLDKTDANRRRAQSGNILISSETDRVYLDTTHDVEIVDPVMRRRIVIGKSNSRNSVVWNPWIDKARSLSDFGDDEWTKMVCVEPSNVGANTIEVAAGQQHTMAVTISVTSM